MRNKMLAFLLRQDPPSQYVKSRRGGGGMVDYLPTQYVIDRLNELFGHDSWCVSIRDLVVYLEAGKGTNKVVSAQVRLKMTVTFPGGEVVEREDVGLCDASNPTVYGARAQAVKGAVSDATKRCARTFGPQFGLGLYGDLGKELGAPGTQEHRWSVKQFRRAVGGGEMLDRLKRVVGEEFEKVMGGSLLEWAQGYGKRHTEVFPATLQEALEEVAGDEGVKEEEEEERRRVA